MGIDPISAGIDAGAGLVGGLANYSAQRKALAANNNDQNRVRKWLDMLLGEQGTAGAQALDARKKAQRQAAGGYDAALGDVSNFGTDATQTALDREQQTLGGAASDLINMGQYNPQHLTLARRGIGYDTTRALTDIASRQSQARSALQVGRGNALAGGSNDIAAQIMANFAGRADIRQNEAQFALSQPATFTDYSQQIGPLFGGIESAIKGSGSAPGRPDTGHPLPNDQYGPV